MNRPQARTEDVLGRITPCIYSPRGQIPFRYAPCRTCTTFHSLNCENYRDRIIEEKVRLPRDYFDWIRKANDRGVVA